MTTAGRTAIITGASRGIGLAIAHRLADEGVRVCLTARTPGSLAEALEGFAPGMAIAVAGKSDDGAHRAETLNRVADEFGGLDILVNNVGINPDYGSLMDLDLDLARKISDVNIVSALGWVQAVVKHERLAFVERRGTIVNINSVTGQVPSDGIGFYGVTKAASAHLTRTLAVELGPEVRVNAVAPALVKTRFASALYEGKDEDAVAAPYPLKRLGAPGDIAEAVAFLASDRASWITGQVLNVDGGLLVGGSRA